MTNADLLTKEDYGHLVDRHLQSGADATMAVRDYEMQVPFGVVRERDGIIEGIEEKPIQRFIVSAGMYVLAPQVLDLVPRQTYLRHAVAVRCDGRSRACARAATRSTATGSTSADCSDYERANLRLRRSIPMIGTRKVLALIPARGGSKGLPGKNILPVGGRPLLAYSVDAARGSRFVDRVVLSSDDDAIIAAALRLRLRSAVPPPGRTGHRRRGQRSTSCCTRSTQLPGYDVLVLLQPTSPLRTAADIDAAFERFAASGAPACVSVSPVEQSPYWMYRLDATAALRPDRRVPRRITRRQDLPPVYALNGAIYVADAAWLRRTRSFVTPATVAFVMPRALDRHRHRR